MNTFPSVLSIAGVDPSGGAGIFADFRAIEAAGVRALGAVTALTVQTESSFLTYEPTGKEILTATIRGMAEAFPGLSVKTGMLPTPEIVITVAKLIEELDFEHIVIDPVIIASVGARLISSNAEKAIVDHLVPLAAILTPNMPEASALTGIPVTDVDSMKEAGEILRKRGAGAAVVTGGHLEHEAIDVLVDETGVHEIPAPRKPGSVHGTGCSFASSVAASLAKGSSLIEAIQDGKGFVARLFDEQRWRGQ